MMNPLIHELFQKSRFLSKELNMFLKKHKLFASQWSVIYCVDLHGEMTLTQIWKYLNVEAPTITRTVNRLEELCWLRTKEGKDRREKVVELTEFGLEQLEAVKKSVIEFEQLYLNNLSDEEQVALIRLLRKLDERKENLFES